MINNKTFSFENQSINTITTVDNNILFEANHVCNILGFANSRDAISRHCFSEDVGKYDTLTKGGKQLKTFINESGLYCLIFGSKKESALKFKKWVTSEVLPTIRQNGSYSVDYINKLENQIQTLQSNNTVLCDAIAKYENGLSKEMAKQIADTVKEKVRSSKPSKKGKAYSYIWTKVKDYFGVSEYKSIPYNQFNQAIEFIQTLRLPGFVEAQQIDMLAQNKPKLGTLLSDEEIKRLIYIQTVSNEVVEALNDIIDTSTMLLNPNCVGRVTFLNESLGKINKQAHILEAILLLKSKNHSQK